MIEEHNFVPFEASPLPKGPWLVFAPHADDETFGMGGSLLLAREQGIQTHVVVVTDGALGGDLDDLVNIRQQEVQTAAKALGLESLQCWDEKDRGLEINPRIIGKITELIREIEPASVFFPGVFEPHPDHRATSQCVWQGLQAMAQQASHQQPQQPQQPITPIVPIAYEIGVQSPINQLIDITAVMKEKMEVIDLYNSQNEENDYPDLIAALNRSRTFSLPDGVVYAEGFYIFSQTALDSPLRSSIDPMYELYWQ